MTLAFAAAGANVLETVVGALIMRRVLEREVTFSRLRDVGVFAFGVVGLSNATTRWPSTERSIATSPTSRSHSRPMRSSQSWSRCSASRGRPAHRRRSDKLAGGLSMSRLRSTCRVFVLILTGAAGAWSCRSAAARQAPPIIQPGSPGEPARVLTPDAAANLPRPSRSEADVKFMQGMIAHHAQAIEMTELLQTRTRRDDMKKLAQRIAVSQADEMKMMRDWLTAHGAEVPGEHAHHGNGGMMMPGMLRPEEMGRLAAASGPEFDKLFLESMIKHHEGALVMVRELFATPGAAQDSDIYAFASDVNADQRMEIARMAALLQELQK
jgi:uncharacterized protein (DUF305 family)